MNGIRPSNLTMQQSATAVTNRDDDVGFEVLTSPGRSKIFPHSTSSRPVVGPTQPPIQWAPGAFPPRVKRPGRESDHPPPTSAEVKNTWIYTSTLPYVFMA
jgi:hypothetical protein